jgi:hypothetical protein
VFLPTPDGSFSAVTFEAAGVAIGVESVPLENALDGATGGLPPLGLTVLDRIAEDATGVGVAEDLKAGFSVHGYFS